MTMQDCVMEIISIELKDDYTKYDLDEFFWYLNAHCSTDGEQFVGSVGDFS